MPIIVIAKMDENSRVYMTYHLESGKTFVVRKSQMYKYDCLNFRCIRDKVEYTQGKSESRIPSYSELNTKDFCYVLYRIKNEHDINIGYRILNIIHGNTEVVDLPLREAVELLERIPCVNGRVVRENRKVFISALKNKFDIIKINTRQKEEDNLSHAISNVQKKYDNVYNKAKSLTEDELESKYIEISKPKEDDKLKLDFINKRIKKKSNISKQLRVAMASCLAVAVIGGAAVIGTGYARPLLNKEVSTKIEVNVDTVIERDTESTRIKLLNSKELSTTFNGDNGKIYSNGELIANITSKTDGGNEIVTITDLNDNIIHSNESEAYEKYTNITATIRNESKKVLKLDIKISGVFGKSLNILDLNDNNIASIKSTTYLNGMRYRIVNDKGQELYKFSGSKLTDKSFQIKKENLVSDISMLDALVIAATYNIHIDDAKYE